MGGFIVGFDQDDASVFTAQRELIARSPIPLAMVGLLTALPGTALWRRLAGEGRLRAGASGDTIPWAVAHAVMGTHMIRYTREEVLPRIEDALAEVAG